MFSKPISHPLFKTLNRGLFGYAGKVDTLQFKDVNIDISGRSERSLNFAVASLKGLEENYISYIEKATEEAYGSYKIMKEVVESGDYDLEEDGGNLPKISEPKEVWNFMVLETIIIEPKQEHKVRLGFQCPWDIEHDFGIYISDNEFQYCGISV